MKTFQIAIKVISPSEGRACLSCYWNWVEREDESMPSTLIKKVLASAQWVGISGKNGPQCHIDLRRKTLEEMYSPVAEEKQLKDSGCDRVNRT